MYIIVDSMKKAKDVLGHQQSNNYYKHRGKTLFAIKTETDNTHYIGEIVKQINKENWVKQ